MQDRCLIVCASATRFRPDEICRFYRRLFFGATGIDEYSLSSGLGGCPVTASIIDLACAFGSITGCGSVILIDRPPS